MVLAASSGNQRLACALVILLAGCLAEPDPSGSSEAAFVCHDGVCIERTEVSQRRYAEFLEATGSAAPEVRAACAGNDLTPGGGWPPAPGDEDRPVGHVDWCDAAAYCQWAGARLCGKIGGGPVSRIDAKNADKDEWFFACTGGDPDRSYPYGSAYQPGICNDSLSQPSVADVTDNPDCVGGLPDLLNMSGNAFEWQDSCESDDEAAGCYVRGGDFTRDADFVTCDTAITHVRTENRYRGIGIRCCRDP